MVTSIQPLKKARILPARRRDSGSPSARERAARVEREVRRRSRWQALREQPAVPGLYLG